MYYTERVTNKVPVGIKSQKFTDTPCFYNTSYMRLIYRTNFSKSLLYTQKNTKVINQKQQKLYEY